MSAGDVIAAAGMAGVHHGVALHLWAFMHQPSSTHAHQLATLLTARLQTYMLVKKIKATEHAGTIARQVLAWWSVGVCKACDGTGYERIQGTPHLSDVACVECHGAGRVPLRTMHDESAQWLASEINAIAASAEAAIHQKLK